MKDSETNSNLEFPKYFLRKTDTFYSVEEINIL